MTLAEKIEAVLRETCKYFAAYTKLPYKEFLNDTIRYIKKLIDEATDEETEEFMSMHTVLMFPSLERRYNYVTGKSQLPSHS